jgi:hypothetical protein
LAEVILDHAQFFQRELQQPMLDALDLPSQCFALTRSTGSEQLTAAVSRVGRPRRSGCLAELAVVPTSLLGE